MSPAGRTRSGLFRVIAVYGLVALLVLGSRPTPWTVTVGFLIAAAGEAVRVWAAGHLRKTVELITSGPYRYSRNPLYLGRLLIFTGVAVMAWLPARMTWAVLGLGYAVFFGYYLRRKERVEPARLLEVHGEAYARYRDAVPALLPRLTPYRGGADVGWSSERMARNREHWMIVGIVVLTLVLLARAYHLEVGSLPGVLGDG
jgi:protein-S-isoprenylcysteine O-methyltransferase Ste14